jgi:hypothetical protein
MFFLKNIIAISTLVALASAAALPSGLGEIR